MKFRTLSSITLTLAAVLLIGVCMAALPRSANAQATVDYALMLQGELVAIMDKDETVLRAGDVLIQRGTNHAWANRSGAPARVAFVLIAGSA